MCSDPSYQCSPLSQLSDEAAVEILDFLQVLTNNFENQYSNQIRRYYDERSRHNNVQIDPPRAADDPSF